MPKRLAGSQLTGSSLVASLNEIPFRFIPTPAPEGSGFFLGGLRCRGSAQETLQKSQGPLQLPNQPDHQLDVGQRETTRNWTAGFSAWFHLPGFFFGVAQFLTHTQLRVPPPEGSLKPGSPIFGPKAKGTEKPGTGMHPDPPNARSDRSDLRSTEELRGSAPRCPAPCAEPGPRRRKRERIESDRVGSSRIESDRVGSSRMSPQGFEVADQKKGLPQVGKAKGIRFNSVFV